MQLKARESGRPGLVCGVSRSGGGGLVMTLQQKLPSLLLANWLLELKHA
jgi:hypothetical protein